MSEETIISAIGENLCQACKFNEFDSSCPHCHRKVCGVCFKETHCLACESEYLFESIESLAEIFHLSWCQWSQKLADTEKLTGERLERWKSLWIDYSGLTEEMKEEDRKWAKIGMGVILEKAKLIKEAGK